MSRLASHTPVVVCEEPVRGSFDIDEIVHNNGVTIVRPHRKTWPKGEPVDEATMKTLRGLVDGRTPLVWLYTPLMLALAIEFRDAQLVYDCMDELASFKDADRRLRPREEALLQRADLVFAGGPSLYRNRIGRTRRLRLYPSGVDVDFFAQAHTTPPHRSVRQLQGPVFGYVGVIDERLDLELIERLAHATPGSVVMVGPVAKIDPSSLPSAPNLHYLGQRPYADLPSLMAGFDVALMPFALNEATRNISPTKTLEYLAAGLPVVSTPVPDVVDGYADIVSIANDASAFIEACGRAADGGHSAERDRLVNERTRAATWDTIATAMWDDVRQPAYE